MGAYTFLLQLFPTTPTTILIPNVPMDFLRKNQHKKGIFDEACAYAYKLADEHGYTFVHPFDDLAVATGQGSIAMEIIKELPTVDYILVPIGGGGLCTGVSTLAKLLNPKIKVIGVEPAGANCMQESLKEGHVLTLPQVNTIADGTAVKRPGEKLFPYIQQNVCAVLCHIELAAVLCSPAGICRAALRIEVIQFSADLLPICKTNACRSVKPVNLSVNGLYASCHAVGGQIQHAILCLQPSCVQGTGRRVKIEPCAGDFHPTGLKCAGLFVEVIIATVDLLKSGLHYAVGVRIIGHAVNGAYAGHHITLFTKAIGLSVDLCQSGSENAASICPHGRLLFFSIFILLL